MPNKVKYKKVILVDSQYQTDGHAPYKILADDYEYYVLKLPKNQADLISIQKEVICSELLKVWEIVTPNYLWLKLSEVLIKENNIKLPVFNYNFGSFFIKDAIDLSNLIETKSKVSSKQINNIDDLFLIALFDIWVLNIDRKKSNNNLLIANISNSLQLIAIDHAYSFDSLKFSDLNPDFGVSFSFNDSILWSPIGMNLIKNTKLNAKWYELMKEKFYFCIKQCETEFQIIPQYLTAEIPLNHSDEKALTNFLFCEDRNKQVFEFFCSIIKDIKK